MTFKIVLSGISGRIRSQVLHQALRSPTITSVIALSRRPFPDLEGHDKLEVVVVENFMRYPEEILAKLSGADGCVWYMTTTSGDLVLEVEYPKAFAKAFASMMTNDGRRFRYVHISGAMVERDQSRTLRLKGSMRKIKEGHISMAAVESYTGGSWETIIARPGMVVQRGSLAGETSMMVAGSSGSFIRSDQLALALLDAVVHGSGELLLPLVLLQRGQKLMREAGETQE
ncbi:hypothetical protein EJ02DRAFT_495068 [Clathrospora elynae]|uniref:NAD(P)-binding domain-containing protein n=1 Tax=Clathrospora elynae TaxID=706981 RepID=A0A6A5SKU2_9PLEO|nr:hypothetical protein EJ02DRAFT_495068 [Clathrospora elynae]